MGEDPGTARTSVAAEGQDPVAGSQDPVAGSQDPVAGSQDPEQIRQEIEATRAELGDTVEALAGKADVKAQVRQRVEATKESAAQKLGQAREASPDSVSSGATQATQMAKDNPIPVAAIGAFVGGFLLGRITKR